MTRGIFVFPDEVLDKCLKELLPQIAGQHSIDSFQPLPVPTDLLNCRLICPILERLATPWAWRRCQMHLHGTSEASERGGSSSEFFTSHPKLAKHVRLLRVAHPTRRWNSKQHPALTELLPALRLMENLRVVLLHKIECPEALTELFHKPHLHTAMMYLCDPSPPMTMKPLENVKHLHVDVMQRVQDVLEMAPQLESLFLSLNGLDRNLDLATLSIPWATLREIDIDVYGISQWHRVLHGFTAWKACHPDTRAPLAEVNIYTLDGIQNRDIELLLTALEGQAIQKLKLSDVHGLDLALLKRIVDTFPQLTELSLLSHGDRTPWPGGLSEIAPVIGDLQYLDTLNWNHVDNPSGDVIIQDRHTAQVLAKHCSRLTQINFSSWGVGESATFWIVRNEMGQYEAFEFQGCWSFGGFHTSAWHPNNYNAI